MILNNQRVTEEIKEEIKKKKTLKIMKTQQSKIYGTQKTVLRRNFIVIQAYLRTLEKCQLNNLPVHLKELKQEEQTKPKISRRKEII